MNGDWQWKLEEALKRIQERYAFVGSKTGASILAVVYPPEAETAVYREWDAQLARLGSDYDVKNINVLALTVQAVADLGSEHIVASMADPMPGSNPQTDLAHMWIAAITREVFNHLDNSNARRPVAVLQKVAALYPATGPRALMQALWDDEKPLHGPVVVLIPGKLTEERVYSFLNREEELMYRGDII